jgi:hypothetical protein
VKTVLGIVRAIKKALNMTEIIDEITLRWALRDIIARRQYFLKVSDATIQRLRELGWVEDRDCQLVATDTGRRAFT